MAKKKRNKKIKVDSTLIKLKKSFPLAESISVHGLYLAIKKGYKFYLTSDMHLVQSKIVIKKLYDVEIAGSVEELPEDIRELIYKASNPMLQEGA